MVRKKYLVNLEDDGKSGHRTPVTVREEMVIQHEHVIEMTRQHLEEYQRLSIAAVVALNEQLGIEREATIDALTDMSLSHIVLVGPPRTFDERDTVSLNPLYVLPHGFVYMEDPSPRSLWQRFTAWLRSLWRGQFGAMLLLSIALLTVVAASAAELSGSEAMPVWVLPGIAARESSSYYDVDGLVFIDREPGKAGELGPFQMKPGTFAGLAQSGELFSDLHNDMRFAELMTVRYLQVLYKRTGNWFMAVGYYHTGPAGNYGQAWRYAKDVQRRGRLATGTQ